MNHHIFRKQPATSTTKTTSIYEPKPLVTSSLQVDEYYDPKSGKYHFLSRKTSTVQQRRHQFECEITKKSPGGGSGGAVLVERNTSGGDVTFRKNSRPYESADQIRNNPLQSEV